VRRPLVALVFAGALAAAGHAQTQSPVTGSIIRGRVVSADSGDALPHARIIIYNDASPLPPIFSDGSGQFASRPLPAGGRYRLSVRKAGFSLTSVSPINVNAPDPLVVRMPRAAAIAGRVVDGFGEPSAGTIVSLYAAPAVGQPRLGAVINRVGTDDLGEYRFGGLAEGTYLVSVRTMLPPPGPTNGPTNSFDLTGIYFPGVTALAQADRIALRPGDERTGVDFSGISSQPDQYTVNSQLVVQNNALATLRPDGTIVTLQPRPVSGNGVIRGTVTRTDGLALVHAAVSTRVTATMPGAPPGARVAQQMVYTDDTGAYEFTQLPPGRYRITAAKLGFTTTVYGQQLEDTTSVANQPPGKTVDLADGQTRTRIDISLPRYSAMTGRVLDDFGDPVENVNVSVSEIRFQAGRRRLIGVPGIVPRPTDDLGRFRLYGLLPGEYIVSSSAGQVQVNQPPSDLSGYAPTYFPGTTNVREAQPVPVARSQDATGVEFVLVPTPTATISGQKFGADGEPMGGSLMLMESQRSSAIITPAAGARIQDDGRFEFPNVAPGDYVIQADHGKANNNNEGDFVAQYVTVNGTSVSDLVLRSTPGSTIRGRVVFEGDVAPSSLRTLAIVPERADLDLTPGNGSIARGDVQPDLTFQITGIHGPRRIDVQGVPAGWALRAVLARGIDVTDMPVKFGTPDQSIDDVQVVLSNRITQLTASIVDANGQPTRDFVLLVYPEDRERWFAGSRYFRRAGPDANGAAIVRGLPPGDYFVVPASGLAVLRDGFDAWQDPDFLEAMAPRATRAALVEGGTLSINARVINK